jgi:hypothetical protein
VRLPRMTTRRRMLAVLAVSMPICAARTWSNWKDRTELAKYHRRSTGIPNRKRFGTPEWRSSMSLRRYAHGSPSSPIRRRPERDVRCRRIWEGEAPAEPRWPLAARTEPRPPEIT